jgi:hypothetical protein
MKASSLADPRRGLYLYTVLVEKVGLQHSLTAAGVGELKNRVEQAVISGELRSRNPESGLPVTSKGEETPIISLDDFNEWLAASHSKHLQIVGVAIPTIRIPRGQLTTAEQQDRALELYGELGYSTPPFTGDKWEGVSHLAREIGWGSRQHWTKMLVAAGERKQRKRLSDQGFSRGSS